MNAHDGNHDEPMFMAMSDDDEALGAAVRMAKETLPHFKVAFSKPQYNAAYFMVKARFVNRDETGEEALVWKANFAGQYDARQAVHIWMTVNDILEDLLFCSTFEVPDSLVGMDKGASFVLEDEDVEDWMVNDGGTLYGGFSMRVLRNAVAEKDRKSFDRYAGISEYREEMP